MEAAPLSPTVQAVIDAARAAVRHNAAGYTDLLWDADTQLVLLDQLGEALEAMDDAA